MLKWRKYIKKNIFFGFSLFFLYFWIFWKYIKSMGQKLGYNRALGARGPTPYRRVMESATMSEVRFWCRFHQWLRLFLLYTVVWSKHNFDNFHFWAKIKQHFKPYALIPIVGDSDDRWCTDNCSTEGKHTETQYFTWFGKTAYIHGRESILFRDWERIQ